MYMLYQADNEFVEDDNFWTMQGNYNFFFDHEDDYKDDVRLLLTYEEEI